jgi:peptidoglycan/xylan/chitin deacetylase (PgdA/CDA1 family)
MTPLQAAKQAVLWGARGLGIERAVARSRWRQRRLAVLCYHGVSLDDEHEWDPRYYVSAPFLETRLRLLRELGCAVLPLGEAVSRLARGVLPPKSVAITFDDGCYDFHARAAPLLRQYEFPATVYLTTFYCGCPQPIVMFLCHYTLWKARETFPPGERLPGFDFAADLSSEEGRVQATARIAAAAASRGLRLPEKYRLAEQLARDLKVDVRPFHERRSAQIMRPEEVAQTASAGFDIQLHTHRHRTPQDRALFGREIEDNRRAIAEMTGGLPTSHFCYPSGVYQRTFLPWLQEYGILSATTCDAGMASLRDHPLLLPRIVDHSRLSEADFVGWVTGARYFMGGGRRSLALGAER